MISFSNADFIAHISMQQAHGLPFAGHLSADLFQICKPDPRVYAHAVRLLGADPDRIMVVSCHHTDLAAARSCGIRTALVTRSDEPGRSASHDAGTDSQWDIVVADLLELADKLNV